MTGVVSEPYENTKMYGVCACTSGYAHICISFPAGRRAPQIIKHITGQKQKQGGMEWNGMEAVQTHKK